MERRNEKLRTGSDAPEENPKANGSVSGPTPNSNMLIRHGTESTKQRPRALSIRVRIDEALAVTWAKIAQILESEIVPAIHSLMLVSIKIHITLEHW